MSRREAFHPQTWAIGAVRIARIVELEGPVPGTFLFADATPEHMAAQPDWLRPRFVDERQRLVSSVHALVIESAGRRIVVDTCVGNDKIRPNPFWNERHGPFLDDLAAGFRASRSTRCSARTSTSITWAGTP